MPKVVAFKVAGLILKFNSLDHMQPHFHALKQGGKWEIRVYFLTCTDDFLDLDYKQPSNQPLTFDGISKSERKELLEKIIANRAELLAEWETKVKVMDNYNAES